MKTTPGAPPAKRAAMAAFARHQKQFVTAMKARALEATMKARYSTKLKKGN